VTVLRCLGKAPKRHDPRTLRLATLLKADLPSAPEVRDWTGPMGASFGMMRNDAIGDCTCAGAGHLIQCWTSNSGVENTISDDDVVSAYSAITGYTPSDPSTDKGAVLLDVLNAWRQTGIGGHQIGAYVLVDHTNHDEVKLALDLFGGLYTGAMLPASAQGMVGGTWNDVRSDDAGSWGGHCMAALAYDAAGVIYATWGARQRATWSWFDAYADEVYAIVSADWVTGAKSAPSGFDLAALQQYLAELK
jgi:hypothetical protein